MSDGFADLIVADSESNADLRYATGLAIPDPFLYIGWEGHRLAVVSDLEFDRARMEAAAGVTVVRQNDFGPPGTDTATLVDALREHYALPGFRVPYDFPLGLATKLSAARIPIRIAPRVFFPERQLKNESEIAELRRAMRVTELAMARALELLRQCAIAADGKLRLDGADFTSEQLRGEIDATLALHGASGVGTIAASGLQSACPHRRGTGPIVAGTPIVIDIFPRLGDSGYHGDLTRTVVKGRAPEIVRRAFDAVRTVRDECRGMIKAGIAGHVPYDHALRRLAEMGFPTGETERGCHGFFHGLGHGLGLEVHEPPRLSRNVDYVLAGGEVVTVEPGVYYPEWGGVRLEDVVVVRADGAECLTEMETFLEID